ncbi:High-affinity zinc uptake system membrane protein ZnuB [compost metagenome]
MAAAMPIVGVLLVSALIVLPAALAIRIAPGFQSALVIAMIIGLTGVFTGLTASYEFSTPPGGTIAFVLLLFLIAGISLKKLIRMVSKSFTSRSVPEAGPIRAYVPAHKQDVRKTAEH